MKNTGFVAGMDYSSIGISTLKITDKMSGKLLKQLSSNLYTKAYESAFREITANMYDAFLTIDREFKADIEYLPNEKKLIFRDYGIGMSHDTVINTYFTKGESVKNEMAESLGGFGIGMLSICSISKSSIISTYYGGYKNSYLLIDLADSIAYKHLGTVEEEGVGTEIILNLSISQNEIVGNLKKSLYFCKGINYINLHVPNIENTPPLYEDDNIYIIEDSSVGSYYGNILLGNTVYPYTVKASDIHWGKVFIKFKTDELEPSLNKEEIRMIQSNIDVIENKVEKLHDFIMKKTDDYYKNKDFNTFNKHYKNPLAFVRILAYFKRYVNDIANTYFKDEKIYYVTNHSNRKEVKTLAILQNKDLNIYYCDSPKISEDRKTYLNSQGIYSYYIIKGTNNIYNFKDYNMLPKPAKSKGVKKPEIMSCISILSGQKITIDYTNNNKTYYYALNSEDEVILTQAMLLQDISIKESSAIKIYTDKGKHIVENYDNFIHAKEITSFNPNVPYTKIFSNYMRESNLDTVRLYRKYEDIIKELAPDIQLYDVQSVDGRIKMSVCLSKFTDFMVNKLKQDMSVLEDIVTYMDNHLYVPYLDNRLLDNKILNILKAEWQHHLDSKNL